MPKLSAYLSSKFFRGSLTPEGIVEELMKLKIANKPNYMPLGKLFGHALGFEETVLDPDVPQPANKKGPSILLLGQFKGLCYETGELKEAAGAYVPNYFRKMVQGQIEAARATGQGALFAIEMGVELTGRTIPFAWVVTNLVPDDAASPMGQLEAKLGNLGIPLISGPDNKPIALEHTKSKKAA